MAITKFDNERWETSFDTTMSTASTNIMSLLPLVAATSMGLPTPVHMKDYPSNSKGGAQVEIEERPSEYLQISEKSFDDISYASIDYIDVQSKAETEFQILEDFVGKILNNSKTQPGDLKLKMYENIDDLLIG